MNKLLTTSIVAITSLSGSLYALNYDRYRSDLVLNYENRSHSPIHLELCSENEGFCLTYNLNKNQGGLLITDPLHSWKIRKVMLKPTGFFFTPAPIICTFPDTGLESTHLWSGSYDIRQFKALKQYHLVIEKIGNHQCRLKFV